MERFQSKNSSSNRIGPRRRSLGWMALCSLGLHILSVASAADALPPPPARYFNDFAMVVRPQTAERLNQLLEDFERQTSNQIVVAIFPKLPEGLGWNAYAQRVYVPGKLGNQ